MRIATYEKLEHLYKKYRGYISTGQLLAEGFSNRQIAGLTEEKCLEKVCHGHYWMAQCGEKKPDDYKCIEVCLSSPRAVIALESACYYQGGIQREPEALIVATERTDRSLMKMGFPVERHYFSSSNFQTGMRRVETAFGGYRIYDVERSFCDIVRLKDTGADAAMMAEIVGSFSGREQYRRILKYAEELNLNKAAAVYKSLRAVY